MSNSKKIIQDKEHFFDNKLNIIKEDAFQRDLSINALYYDPLKDKIIDYFHDRKIYLRRYFHPGCHNLEPYINESKYHNLNLPNTEKVSRSVIIFPTGQQMTSKSVNAIYEHYQQAMLTS